MGTSVLKSQKLTGHDLDLEILLLSGDELCGRELAELVDVDLAALHLLLSLLESLLNSLLLGLCLLVILLSLSVDLLCAVAGWLSCLLCCWVDSGRSSLGNAGQCSSNLNNVRSSILRMW